MRKGNFNQGEERRVNLDDLNMSKGGYNSIFNLTSQPNPNNTNLVEVLVLPKQYQTS